MNAEIVGKRIKQSRERKRMTQEELGKALGMNKSTIQRYETGKISRIKLPVLQSIAEILSVNPNYLALKTNDPIDYDSIPEYQNIPDAESEYFGGDEEKAAEIRKYLNDMWQKEIEENAECRIEYDTDMNRIYKAKLEMPNDEWKRLMAILELTFGKYFKDDTL